ncbi:hypothetical protein [Streptomyces sp. SM14]|uniref:hypothetical protein n=1 Tax=Streptomyces sp. SM14 TaxID=1736045 RepID=UPI000CD4BA56|nr:hypothetical protein [Streptomyces sp. SM14]
MGSSLIADLWAAGMEVPIKDGLYFGTGEALRAELVPGADAGVRFLDPFDLATEMREDPENVTSVDISVEESLEDGSRLVCGYGSWGSEGFLGRLMADGAPQWIMYFEFSNPFVGITRKGRTATFLSTADIQITVDIDDPRNSPLGLDQGL